jgi:putative membrane protein
MIAAASLPALNAALNATSAMLLIAGFVSIRSGKTALHTGCMLAACATSTLFLASYLYYHAQVGSVHFTGTGWIRGLYLTILLSHTVLAVVIVPLVLRTLWLAARKRLAAHRAVARWTLPLWLYVSITGVLVYGMLYQWKS